MPMDEQVGKRRESGETGGTRESERRAGAAARERRHESLTRQSVPTAAQHTSTFSRLSLPFLATDDPRPPPPAGRRSSSRVRVCSSFDFSLSVPLPSLPLSRCFARAHAQTRLLSSSSYSSRPSLPFSFSLFLCSTRVSSRTTGRSCNLAARIYARINHRGKRSRGKRGRE